MVIKNSRKKNMVLYSNGQERKQQRSEGMMEIAPGSEEWKK